jgi:hypothetical protein
MAGRRVSNKRVYALWKESPSLVSNDDLWRVLAILRDHEADRLRTFLVEVAGRDLDGDPDAALRVRNVLRDLPEQLKALRMWQDAMRRAERIVEDYVPHGAVDARGRRRLAGERGKTIQ